MINTFKVVAVIQARMDSSRLPNKALLPLNGVPSIIRMINRVKLSQYIDKIVLATSTSHKDDILEKNVINIPKLSVFRGDENDVLSRFVKISKITKADLFVRLTGDCPLIDYAIIDQIINLLVKNKADYASNITKRTYPDGLDVEAFTIKTLLETDLKANDAFSREHVTSYMHGLNGKRNNSGNFKKVSLENEVDFSHLRWTLDERKDLDFIDNIYKKISFNASWQEIIALIIDNPLIHFNNSVIPTNQGSKKKIKNFKDRYSNSNKFFNRAIKTIPLGSQTFSKSYMQWPKGAAPLFLERGYGANVVDIDGNHYIDFVLGLLPITIGYCDKDVDGAVLRQLMKGTVFSLPSLLEMELSEKLVGLIPSAQMVRFGKNGSDVTTAAIRLARAYTNREMVAVAGYHGWHDWYIATSSRNLGVPKVVEKLTHRFNFNDVDSLKHLFKKFPNKFAAVILEPSGLVPTDINFLNEVKKLCRENGALLIFDEIISGFRINMGGAQSEYGVTPDISCFGKGMANGYPLSAVVGSRKIMKLMEKIFFSTTFGGETLSLAASIATINKIKQHNVIKKNNLFGGKLINALNQVCDELKVKDLIKISEVTWWPQILIGTPPIKEELFISLLRQEFLKSGLLLGATFNLCFAHTQSGILELTIKSFRESIKNVKQYLNSGDPEKNLKGEFIQKTFKVR